LCFLVGDVTGKSVSGALVMSAARSVFRMLSEEHLTVGDIMISRQPSNQDGYQERHVCGSSLCGARLQSENAEPLQRRANPARPLFRSEGEGSAGANGRGHFPLGILDEADYKETRVQLELGDKVVFYTDGIVEAMDKEKEIFGFERLQKVVEESQTMSAEALLQEIMDGVNKFVGEAPQHDDLTAIVVTVTSKCNGLYPAVADPVLFNLSA